MKREGVIALVLNPMNGIQTSKSRFEEVIIMRKDEKRRGNKSGFKYDIHYSNKQI